MVIVSLSSLQELTVCQIKCHLPQGRHIHLYLEAVCISWSVKKQTKVASTTQNINCLQHKPYYRSNWMSRQHNACDSQFKLKSCEIMRHFINCAVLGYQWFYKDLAIMCPAVSFRNTAAWNSRLAISRSLTSPSYSIPLTVLQDNIQHHTTKYKILKYTT